MQEVFENIIEKLEELRKAEIERDDLCDEEGCGGGEEIYEDGKSQGRFEQLVRIIEIVKQEAEQYNNGWIPCSERLPERYCHCLVTRINEYEDGFDTDVREDTYVEIEGVWDWQSNHEGLIDKVIAWQPLPEAYKQNGETYE